MLCVQLSWTMLTGESPVQVIAKEPSNQSPGVTEMLGLKREGNVLERVLVKMQVVTLSEFCRIVKKGLFFFRDKEKVES